MSDFIGYAIKAIADALVPILDALVDLTPWEFDSFQDVLNLYEGGIALPDIPLINQLKQQIPFELLKEIVSTEGKHLFRLPKPKVIESTYLITELS